MYRSAPNFADNTPMPPPQTPIARLRNLGAASQRMLSAAALHTLGDLEAVGSVEAYWRVLQAQQQLARPAPSLNLLWAIEGALTDLPWQTVAREHRTSLLLALDSLQHDRRHA